MLKDLEILNGELSLKFDSLNTIYTVKLNNNDNKLDFKYSLDDDVAISILGNDNLNDGSIVKLTVNNQRDEVTYTFNVYKEENSEVVKTISDFVDVSVNKKEMEQFVAPAIASICFLIVIITFSILFHSKKVKK